MASGLLIAAGGSVLLGLGPDTPYGRLALAYALLGAGQGLVNPPVTNAGVSGMPPEQAGVASAVISTTRQIGNVLGVAAMGAMLTASLRARLAAGTPRGQALSEATHGPWALAVACGLLIAVVGLVTTTARRRPAAPGSRGGADIARISGA